MATAMRFHPGLRTGICQIIALAGFLVFLGIMRSQVPQVESSEHEVSKDTSPALFVSLLKDPPEEAKPAPADKPPVEPDRAEPPRRPERFRPSVVRMEEEPTAVRMPPAAARPRSSATEVAVPPRDLPLSYLMKFQSMAEFHSFLEELPQSSEPGARTMSLIRIEGLPETVAKMRRLFESYRLEPFLFNPDRFNYIITSDLRLLRDPAAIRTYVSTVGRYLHEREPSAAYGLIRSEFVNRARRGDTIRQAITDEGEFDRMELGLASLHLSRFFRKLEQDTARQVSELTGRAVAVRDIARIDCRFKDVSGVMVLVPWRAYLGSDPGRSPISIWDEG